MKVNLYARKKQWKIILAIVALAIISISTYYINNLVNHFAKQEKIQIKVWADAVQHHATLMKYTETLFKEVSEQERSSVELLAKTYHRLLADSPNEKLDFYLGIVQNNKTIPVIIADENHRVILNVNLPEDQKDIDSMTPDLLKEYTVFKPIPINLGNEKKQWLYYKESLIYTELKDVLDDLFNFFLNEVTGNSVSAPVIIMDSTRKNVLQYGNLSEEKMQDSAFVAHQIEIMEAENEPISFDFLSFGKAFIYYRSSDLLMRMQFYPLLQIVLIALLICVAYLLFSYARRSEQNQVWAGMAKETAHQIGTPLSSLMAWNELLKMQPDKIDGIEEMEKDIQRLDTIAERFSKIGSQPILEPVDVVPIITETMDYLKTRCSRRVEFDLQIPANHEIILPLSASLFRWVIENLVKNAIDAMGGQGKIILLMKEEPEQLIIDLTDTGKGIPKSAFKQIFNPGYTSKKRGWGLGLSLAKRIIQDYHKGKIFVKSSVINEGTTFRIILRKK